MTKSTWDTSNKSRNNNRTLKKSYFTPERPSEKKKVIHYYNLLWIKAPGVVFPHQKGSTNSVNNWQ
jgi:hypothetical protein